MQQCSARGEGLRGLMKDYAFLPAQVLSHCYAFGITGLPMQGCTGHIPGIRRELGSWLWRSLLCIQRSALLMLTHTSTCHAIFRPRNLQRHVGACIHSEHKPNIRQCPFWMAPCRHIIQEGRTLSARLHPGRCCDQAAIVSIEHSKVLHPYNVFCEC